MIAERAVQLSERYAAVVSLRGRCDRGTSHPVTHHVSKEHALTACEILRRLLRLKMTARSSKISRMFSLLLLAEQKI